MSDRNSTMSFALFLATFGVAWIPIGVVLASPGFVLLGVSCALYVWKEDLLIAIVPYVLILVWNTGVRIVHEMGATDIGTSVVAILAVIAAMTIPVIAIDKISNRLVIAPWVGEKRD